MLGIIQCILCSKQYSSFFYSKQFMVDKKKKQSEERRECLGRAVMEEERQTRSSVCHIVWPLLCPSLSHFSLASLTFCLSVCFSLSLFVWPVFFSAPPISALPASHEVIITIPILPHSESLMQLNELQGGRKEGHIEKFSRILRIRDYGLKQIFSQHY